MNILVLNCGSSSLKYRLISMPEELERASGEAQRIGPPTAEPSRIVHRLPGQPPRTLVVPMASHGEAFTKVMSLLSADPTLAPDAAGHRVVHGGPHFERATVVDDAVIDTLDALRDLAPLHNPQAVALLKACRDRYPDLPQVAVLDTAFHSTIPDYASTYALPEALRRAHGIRKYGFHGISHGYVAAEAARFLGMPPGRLNAVSCHLGSGGASLCAIVDGRSADNTMGFSPLQGLIMSTRCGDLNPAIALHLLAQSEGDRDAVERLLNERSGVLGLSGRSADIRDTFRGATEPGTGSPRGQLTAQVYLWRLRKYLGAYLAAVARADAVIFTDTIGETVPVVRSTMCTNMEVFGVEIDGVRNARPGPLPADVATPGSAVRILVIATNEELAIARAVTDLYAATSAQQEGARQ